MPSVCGAGVPHLLENAYATVLMSKYDAVDKKQQDFPTVPSGLYSGQVPELPFVVPLGGSLP